MVQELRYSNKKSSYIFTNKTKLDEVELVLQENLHLDLHYVRQDIFCSRHPLRKIPKFHLISWC